MFGNIGMICTGTLLAGAAAWDWAERRIPNWWLAFWLAQAVWCRHGYLAEFAAGALIAAICTGILFFFRMIGAGDCKLIALVCGYLGIRRGAAVVAAAFLLGAVWSLGKLLIQKQLFQRLSYFLAWFRQSIQTQKRIPYYCPERDGRGITVPLAVCMLAGFLAAAAGGI